MDKFKLEQRHETRLKLRLAIEDAGRMLDAALVIPADGFTIGETAGIAQNINVVREKLYREAASLIRMDELDASL